MGLRVQTEYPAQASQFFSYETRYLWINYFCRASDGESEGKLRRIEDHSS